MSQSDNNEAIKAALRVLNAVVDRKLPDSADIEALRRFAPTHAHLSNDDLAREVIQQARKNLATEMQSSPEKG